MDVDLSRGQADAGRGIHRLEHVVDERLELGVDFCDRFRANSQPRVRILQYWETCHCGINQVIRTIHVQRVLKLARRQTENHVRYKGPDSCNRCKDAAKVRSQLNLISASHGLRARVASQQPERVVCVAAAN